MIRDIQEIQSLATKYSKQQLAHMAQIGMIDPTKAVMAGMMRDRISKEDAKPPTTTVAQDVMGIAPQQMGMQPEQSQPQQAPQGQPQQAPTGVASLPQEPQPNAGIEALPAGEVGSYAGGGIVAFDDGGSVPGFKEAGLIDVASLTKTMQERQAEIANIDKELAKNPPNSPDLQQKRGMLAELVQRAQTKLSANTDKPAGVASLPVDAPADADAAPAEGAPEQRFSKTNWILGRALTNPLAVGGEAGSGLVPSLKKRIPEFETVLDLQLLEQ
jgi:hypothetical protein